MVTGNSKLISYSYTAYGELLPESPEPKVYGYNAEETDYTTGLQYLRARYYNTDTGNFIQKDAYKGDFTQPGTLNRYAYCAGNPVNRVDPSGYRPIEGVDVTDPTPSEPTTETPIDTTDINQIDYSGNDEQVLDATDEDESLLIVSEGWVPLDNQYEYRIDQTTPTSEKHIHVRNSRGEYDSEYPDGKIHHKRRGPMPNKVRKKLKKKGIWPPKVNKGEGNKKTAKKIEISTEEVLDVAIEGAIIVTAVIIFVITQGGVQIVY